MRFSSNILQTASNCNGTDKEQLACQTPQYTQQLTKNTAAADCGQYILQNKVKDTRLGNKSQLAENHAALTKDEEVSLYIASQNAALMDYDNLYHFAK